MIRLAEGRLQGGGRILTILALGLAIVLLAVLALRLARPPTATPVGIQPPPASVGEAWSQFVSRRLHAAIARRGDVLVISTAAEHGRPPIALPLNTPVEADCDTLNRSGSLIFRSPGRVLSVPIFGAETARLGPERPPTLDAGRHDAAAVSLSDRLCLQILDEAKAVMAPRPDLEAGHDLPATDPVHPSADRSAAR